MGFYSPRPVENRSVYWFDQFWPEDFFEVVVIVVFDPVDFQVNPRKPPRTPSTSPMKLNETMEKTSVNTEPVFLWASLLYSSHDPTITRNPATGARILTIDASRPGMLMAVRES